MPTHIYRNALLILLVPCLVPFSALGQTTPDQIETLPDFKVELVLKADKQRNGSWISMALDTKGKQALEMLNGGRTHATLPLPNGLLADTKEPAQFSLGQVHALAQRRTGAPKGVLTFEVIGMRLFHLPSL